MDDTVRYFWTCYKADGTLQDGTFPYGNEGRTVTWKAPAAPGNYTVMVVADDVNGQAPLCGDGSDNDDAKTAQQNMQVIRLDKVRLYYHNDTQPAQPYPATSDQVSFRAIVWATHVTQATYCDLGLQNDGRWYATGTAGDPLQGNPPTLGGGVAPSAWPGNWPALTFHWRTLPHAVDTETAKTGVQTYNQAYGPNECGLQGGIHDGNHTHKRRYFIYMDYQGAGISNWGANGLQLAQGTKRYQATVKMHETQSWKQTVKSLGPTTTGQNQWSQDCDEPAEYPLRVSVRAADLGLDPNGTEYLRWISCFKDIPYEWGGHWFGGKANAVYDETYIDNAYNGYGTDCSGLVSIGAWFAGYNWNPWRATTSGLAGAYYTTPRTKDNCAPGDILNSPGVHVITICEKDGDSILAIEASGDANRVIRWTQWQDIQTDWIDRGYTVRRLNPH